MKKLIAILTIAIVLVCAVFATDPTVDTATQRLTLKSDVAKVAPNYTLKGSMDEADLGATAGNDAITANTATAYAGTVIESGKSIADEDIEVFFAIYQFGNKDAAGETQTYARFNQQATLTVTITTLKEVSPKQGASAKEIAGSITASAVDAAGSYTGSVNGVEDTYANEIVITKAELAANAVTTSFIAKYNGKVANQRIATFTAKWLQDSTAPNGTYKADITMEISVQ